MKTNSVLRKAALFTAAFLLGPAVVRAQVTITSADMFNQIDQYYRAYANNSTNPVSVSARLGSPGGPQAWDFSTGPQDVVYRFDYRAVTDGKHGADFLALGAQLAEQKTDEADLSTRSWLYFTQDPAKGRLDYGFFDPTFSALQPESVFTNVLQDFPGTIHNGDTWQGTTVFESIYSDAVFGDFPERVTYSAAAKVDAYGVVTLPGLGFLDCLRIHEAIQYDIELDFGDGSGYQAAGTQYGLNYYWLAPGHGIVVQINSRPSDSGPPPDNLPGGATALVRMFETNHGENTGPPATTYIQDFKITLGRSGGALLMWTLLPTVTSYRVDYATSLANPVSWHSLGTTTANYVIDSVAGTTSAPARFYRVVGLN